METDCAFSTGKSHQVCQDYARAGKGCVLVSDGCSSSPDTDIGSRLLVLEAEQALRFRSQSNIVMQKSEEVDAFYKEVIVGARRQAAHLELSDKALDATLLAAVVSDNRCLLTMWGDGYLAWRRRATTETEGVRVTYEAGYPNYLNYVIDEERRKALGDRAIGKAEFFHLEKGKMVVENTLAVPRFFSQFLSVYDLSFVVLASDGLGSFQEHVQTETSKAVNPVPFEEMLLDMIDFKSTFGVFVQRRFNKVLKERLAKNQDNYDDLGIAAIAF